MQVALEKVVFVDVVGCSEGQEARWASTFCGLPSLCLGLWLDEPTGG